MSHIGKYLANYRATDGISQREMASLLGVSHVYICKLETGRVGMSLRAALELAVKLNVNAEDMANRWIRDQFSRVDLPRRFPKTIHCYIGGDDE